VIFGYKTFIDGIPVPKVISTTIDLNSVPKRAKIEFYADVEPIEFEGIVEKKIFAIIGHKKYDISEIVKEHDYKETTEIIQKRNENIIIFTVKKEESPYALAWG
jgi:hypothetical protein